MIETLDFKGMKWHVKAKLDGRRLDDPSTLKENYGCDLVIKNAQNVYFILDEIIDVEFEEL